MRLSWSGRPISQIAEGLVPNADKTCHILVEQPKHLNHRGTCPRRFQGYAS